MIRENSQDNATRAGRVAIDHALRARIGERLAKVRDLDLRHVEISVEDGEVILDGKVGCEADRREVEAIADIDGVRRVRNNLEVHEHTRWTFL